MARVRGAETIDFTDCDAYDELTACTKGRGPVPCIDAVGSIGKRNDPRTALLAWCLRALAQVKDTHST